MAENKNITVLTSALADLKSDLKLLNQKVNYAIAVVTTVASVVIPILFYQGWVVIPNKSDERFQRIEAKIDKQGETIASLIATVTLQQPDAAKVLPQVMKEELKKGGGDIAFKSIAEIARQAHDRRLVVQNPQEVSDVGLSLLRVAGPNPSVSAWSATTNLLAYVCQLREPELEKIGPQNSMPDTQVGYEIGIFEQQPSEVHFHVTAEFVPIAEAASAEKIGGKSTFENGTINAPKTLVIASLPSVVLNITNYKYKNVVFDGLTIEYDGGPLLMDNVTFINCKFILPPSKNGVLFARTVLQAPSASVQLG